MHCKCLKYECFVVDNNQHILSDRAEPHTKEHVVNSGVSPSRFITVDDKCLGHRKP